MHTSTTRERRTSSNVAHVVSGALGEGEGEMQGVCCAFCLDLCEAVDERRWLPVGDSTSALCIVKW